MKGSDVKDKKACTECGPAGVEKMEEETKFKNQKQQRIFEHLLATYPKNRFDCFYLCDSNFRQMVHGFGGSDPARPVGPAGENVVNSVRIEDVIQAVNQAKPEMSPDDDRLKKVIAAVEKLDAADRTFLKGAEQSAPFWARLKAKLPAPTLESVTRKIKK